MREYFIKPLKQAGITAPIGVGMMMQDIRQTVTCPVFVWFIEGAKEKILVDAGVSALGEDGKVCDFPVEGGGEEGLRNALNWVGTSPEEIDILILTHLHFDHTACARLFKNSRIYVQKREWETAFNPIPSSRPHYDSTLFGPLENMDLILVEGDHEISDGIKLLYLPGHTQGLQGVALSTKKGTAVLASDLCYTYLNINSPFPETPFYPPGIHVDLTEWFDSMWKVIRIASKRELIYPGHDPSLEGKTLPG